MSNLTQTAAGLAQGVADWWRLGRYPVQWRNDHRLASWRQHHERADSNVWALWPAEACWELYAPGSVQEVLSYGNPYVAVTPSGLLYPAAGAKPDLPLTYGQELHMKQEVARLTGRPFRDFLEGLRPLDKKWTSAVPIIYVRAGD